MGTEPDDARIVKLTKKTHSTTPYTTREKQTSELPAGERKVEQKGQEGLSMTVWRNVYDKNGKLVESYVENKSKYKPMPEIVLVGTGKSQAASAPAASEVKPPETAGTETPAPAPEATAPEATTPTPAPETPAPTPENATPETSEPVSEAAADAAASAAAEAE